MQIASFSFQQITPPIFRYMRVSIKITVVTSIALLAIANIPVVKAEDYNNCVNQCISIAPYNLKFRKICEALCLFINTGVLN